MQDFFPQRTTFAGYRGSGLVTVECKTLIDAHVRIF
jgi:hypothetical protein